MTYSIQQWCTLACWTTCKQEVAEFLSPLEWRRWTKSSFLSEHKNQPSVFDTVSTDINDSLLRDVFVKASSSTSSWRSSTLQRFSHLVRFFHRRTQNILPGNKATWPFSVTPHCLSGGGETEGVSLHRGLGVVDRQAVWFVFPKPAGIRITQLLTERASSPASSLHRQTTAACSSQVSKVLHN